MNRNDFKDTFEEVPQGFKNRVRSTLNNLPDKEENIIMIKDKKLSKIGLRKRVLITLAATMLLGTGVFAIGKLTSVTGVTSHKQTYTSIPTASQVDKDFGFSPNIVKEFSNGYTFDKSHTTDVEGTDDDGNVLDKSKELLFVYKNGENEINISMTNNLVGEISKDTELIKDYKDVDIYYNQYAYKFVPTDYEMTEQDKKDEASGKYVFSVGSDKVEIDDFKFLGFEKDGVTYSISAMNNDISKEEMVKMASEIIDLNQ